jgi:uncharacterized membrane protein
MRASRPGRVWPPVSGKRADGYGPTVGKGRTESFSDGVLAVAITLLALNLHVDPGRADLWSQVVYA